MNNTRTILAADIGGTKSIFAIYLYEKGLVKIHSHKYKSKMFSSFESMIETYLDSLPKDVEHPDTACIALAGPVENGFCKLTNLGWEINKQELINRTNITNIEIINDFSVLIYGLPHLEKSQYVELQADKFKNGIRSRVAIVGAGTGLGIARGLITDENIISIPSEGGHTEFSPSTLTEWDIYNWIKKDMKLSRVSKERVVSGTGLGNIAKWRLSLPDAKGHPLKNICDTSTEHMKPFNKDFPAIVSEEANKGDSVMKEVINIWLHAYGSAAGDIALHELCTGGLWIAGGTASKQLPGLKSKVFIEAFRNKGRFNKFLKKIRVCAITDNEVGLFSAGCKAKHLVKSNEKMN